MSARDLSLLENTFLRRRIIRKTRKVWVNEIFKKRKKFGELQHIWEDLKNNEEKFFSYFRMKEGTFNFILNVINDSIMKYCNIREPISSRECLALTMRYISFFLIYDRYKK